MPRGKGGRGKVTHKGQRRHFSDVDDLKHQEEKLAKEKEWRRQRGIESDEEEKDEDAAGDAEPKKEQGAPGELPTADSSSSSEEESSEDESGKPKGVEHLIEVENPNRMVKKTSRKVTDISTTESSTLSRKEKEELEKQEARRKYQQLHMEGKTDEARADLARLALIRKQRDDAAKKEDDRIALEAAKAKEKKKS